MNKNNFIIDIINRVYKSYLKRNQYDNIKNAQYHEQC
jgi:hypothetical protein